MTKNEKINEYQREWNHANPEKRREYNRSAYMRRKMGIPTRPRKTKTDEERKRATRITRSRRANERYREEEDYRNKCRANALAYYRAHRDAIVERWRNEDRADALAQTLKQ